MTRAIVLHDDVPILSKGFLRPPGTFTRNSDGTVWQKQNDGSVILVTRTEDQQRRQFDPATGELRGMSAYSQTMYRSLHSNDLTQSEWTKSNITPTQDQVGLKGEANTATRLTATAANGTAIQSLTLASGGRTADFWLKRITGTGAVEITLNGGSTWEPVDLGSDYAHFHVSDTLTDPAIGIRITTSGDEVAVGNAVIHDGLVAFIAPEITAGVTKTRADENPVVPDIHLQPWWNPSYWTIQARAIAANGFDINQHLIDIRDSTESVFLRRDNASGRIRVNTPEGLLNPGIAVEGGAGINALLGYDGSRYRFSVNGQIFFSGATETQIESDVSLGIGVRPDVTTLHWDSEISSVDAIIGELSDEKFQELSSL